MAPYTAESARSTRAKPNAPAPVVPRIVPAIPLSFARSNKSRQQPPQENPRPADALPEPQQDDALSLHAAVQAREREQPTPPALPEPAQEPPSSDRDKDQGGPGDATAGVTVDAEPIPAPAQTQAPSTEQTAAKREQSQVPSQEPAQPPLQPTNSIRPQKPPFELPPPFYPSTERSTPTSATSSTFARPPPQNITMHNPRPSTNSIVFGGYPDSSCTSPAPPVTNGHMPYPPPPPPPPPGFMGANFIPPPMAFQGHNHHFSEPHAGMMYPTMAVPPGSFGFRRDQPLPFRPGQQWIPPNGPPQHRLGGQEPFPAHQVPPHVNGVHPLSRSGSQASSPRVAVPEEEVDGAGMRLSGAPMANGVHLGKPSTFVPRDPELGLRDYLRSQFGNPDFADYVLKLYQGENRNLLPPVLPVHGLIVARNPRMSALIASAGSARFEGRMRILDVFVSDRFFDGHIFAEALKHLYGEDLLSTASFTNGLHPFTGYPSDSDGFGSPQQRMRHALAYAAAGYFLEIPSIVARGLDIATELLRWDTLEIALSFAMDGGLDASWRADDDKSSATSSDDASSKFDTDSLPTYGTYSTQFLQTIVGFLVHNFPADYELDPSAPHLPSMPRLPPLPESRPTSRNPRLSQIRFGQVPEKSGTSRYVISLLSSIFLSLPFPILKALLEDYVLCSRLSGAIVGQIAQSVVEEREIRRRKIWKIQMTHPNAFERDDALRHNLLWTERVESSQQALGGFRLARSHQGIDTPASTVSNKSSERVS